MSETSEPPQHGDRGVCVICGLDIEYIEYTAWNGYEEDVLDSWWSHKLHPTDGHEATNE